MIVDREIVRASRGAAREIGIWPLLVWAFKSECAQLDPPDVCGSIGGGFGFASMTSIIAQHEMLGCRVDGGGRSDPHPDADLIAAALSLLPDRVGGWRMATMIAEHARGDTLPGWQVRTAIEPRGMMRNQHERQAETDDAKHLGAAGWQPVARTNRRGATVFDAVRYCPVTIRGGAAEAAAKRRAYLSFWGALLDLRATFQIGRDLSAWRVSDAMPPRDPWKVAAIGGAV